MLPDLFLNTGKRFIRFGSPIIRQCMRALRLSNVQKWFVLAVVTAATYIAFWSGLEPRSLVPVSGDAAVLTAFNTYESALVNLKHDATAVKADAALAATQELLSPTINAGLNADTVTEVAADRTEAWQVGNHRTPTPSIPLNEKIVDYTIVEIAADSAVYPQTGEEVVLPLLKGEKVVAVVETTITNPNGDYTWRGHLQGHGNSYPIVMTYGASSVMATITTPAGSYSMTTVKGLGWLYKNPAEVQLVDTLQNDFLEPPIHHYHDGH